MTRYFWVLLGLWLVLGSCTQRMVCPAYQSAFIYDKDELRKKFSYFQEDSFPKVLTASKNKYLIAEPVSYRKKLRSMATVEMKQVPVKVPDSLTAEGDVSLAELDLAARSVMDTIVASGYQQEDTTKVAEDSIYVITKDKELRLLKYDPDSIKYRVVDVRLNVDQDNYMWYLRDYLILPDVRLARNLQNGEAGGNGKSSNGKKEKKGIKGFFKNLFKRKNKAESDTTEVAPPPRDEFDFVDTTGVEGPAMAPRDQPAEQKKKGGIFSFLKKKDKAAKPDSPADKPKKERKKKEKKKKKSEDPIEEEEKPEEDKDDGF
jgi:hypothetical protein